MGRLAKRIIDNVQITINNVHVRLEISDNVGLGEPLQRPIVLGATMDSLKLETTDKNWNTVFVDSSEKQADAQLRHRLGQIQGLSLYCRNSDLPEQLLTNTFAEVSLEHGQALSEAFGAVAQGHGYLLTPVNTEVRLKVGNYPHPQYTVSAKLDAIEMSLSEVQAEDIVDAVQQIVKAHRRAYFLDFRPKTALRSSSTQVERRSVAKAWWMYAMQWARWQAPIDGIRCIADPGRCTWRRLGHLVHIRYEPLSLPMSATTSVYSSAVLCRCQYKELYKRSLRTDSKFTWLCPLEEHEAMDMSRIERELPISSTVSFRALARSELDQESSKVEERTADAPSAGWFAYLYQAGTAASSPRTDQAEVLMTDIELTAQERQRLYDDLSQMQGTYQVWSTLYALILCFSRF
jgi:hypothetical protein